ncbi:D-alanyl-D-alanine carboxypeptidase [Catellatospora methionotrophica]|uniref:D-alanyl-D-alanine carboxypeptidase n=1 Tax=Catellatospora methionotrophica TaxID=121620 RepID=A0A8J3LG67_9ACTN|nr:M15 family metallopeptidase [Catellatospora methionotrophica]GIG14949.1 D-alanyl-D-alanine carboxypeptidase [Catellatospora methionotrophica]
MSCPSPRPSKTLRFGVGIAAAAVLTAVPAYRAVASAADGTTASDGALDRPVSPFDDGRPALDRLDPALLAAVRQAARDARRDGVELQVNSGWRSPRHQQHLLDEAVAEHGSDEARRQVLPPDRSSHVTGRAVDIGPVEADRWLQRHGPAYGLCQVYANEIWHFELRTAPGGSCPPRLPDASAG